MFNLHILKANVQKRALEILENKLTNNLDEEENHFLHSEFKPIVGVINQED